MTLLWVFLYALAGAITFGVIAAHSDVDTTPSWKLMRGLAVSIVAWPFLLASAATVAAITAIRSRP